MYDHTIRVWHTKLHHTRMVCTIHVWYEIHRLYRTKWLWKLGGLQPTLPQFLYLWVGCYCYCTQDQRWSQGRVLIIMILCDCLWHNWLMSHCLWSRTDHKRIYCLWSQLIPYSEGSNFRGWMNFALNKIKFKLTNLAIFLLFQCLSIHEWSN